MSKNLTKHILRKIVWSKKKKTISQILRARCRKDGFPEFGRFTPGEIDRIIIQSVNNINELIPKLIDHDNIGNYQNEFIGLVDLAIYRSLIAAMVDGQYAARLVADMMWQTAVNSKGLIPVIDSLRKEIIKLYVKDPLIILEKRLLEMMKYPYGSPGYQIDFTTVNDKFHMDIHSCPVFDFYKQFGNEEMKFFRQTWCTFDYTAAEHVVKGGKYERAHTLSDGDQVCDMRWYIDTMK